MDDQTRAWYLEHRKVLSDASADQISRFETAILASSSAGVAAVFFLVAQNSMPPGVSTGAVISTAAFFAASFFCILMSHLTSHMDMELEIKKFDLAFKQDNYGGVGSNIWGSITQSLNCLSPILLAIGGSVFLAILLFGMAEK